MLYFMEKYLTVIELDSVFYILQKYSLEHSCSLLPKIEMVYKALN